MTMRLVALSVTFLLMIACVMCRNPVVANVGMADPHVHFWQHIVNGPKFYMYSTHDYSPNNTDFLMKNWWVWSSHDLVQWTQESILMPQNTPSPPAAWNECWATDAAAIKDSSSPSGYSYFFYLSIGPDQVAVMKSPSPSGPWIDVLGKPFLPAALGSKLNPPTTIRDPCVFADDDGANYIIFGVFTYYIAKLGPNMASIDVPKLINVINPTGPYGNKTDDKPFLHKFNGQYYLSWGCFYGTSDSVYGPYTYRGSFVQTEYIVPAFRMNDTAGPWYSHQDYADRHGSFWTANGQWYNAANDRSHSTDPENRSVFRDTVMSYVHYFNNGTIAPVVIDEIGVGSYRANRIIEAENYFSVENAFKSHDENGKFSVHGIKHGSVLVYQHIQGVSRNATLELRISNGGLSPCKITVHMDIVAGPLLATAILPTSGNWETFGDLRIPLELEGGLPYDLSLVLAFHGNDLLGEPELARLDSLIVLSV